MAEQHTRSQTAGLLVSSPPDGCGPEPSILQHSGSEIPPPSHFLVKGELEQWFPWNWPASFGWWGGEGGGVEQVACL